MSRTEGKIIREHLSHLTKGRHVKLVYNFKLKRYPEWNQEQEEPLPISNCWAHSVILNLRALLQIETLSYFLLEKVLQKWGKIL